MMNRLLTMIFLDEASMPLISFPRPGIRNAKPGSYPHTERKQDAIMSIAKLGLNRLP